MKGVIVMEYNSTKEREVAEAMESGKYKVADLSIFKDFESMKFSDKLFSHIEYTTDLLNEHLSMIMDFKDTTPGIDEYLKAVRVADILDNQHLEKENSFMIGMYYHVIFLLIMLKKEKRLLIKIFLVFIIICFMVLLLLMKI